MRITSWNIAQSRDAWRCLLDMEADVALLQGASKPPSDVSQCIRVGPGFWETAGKEGKRPWRTTVVKLSDKVSVDWIEAKPTIEADSRELAVSQRARWLQRV